MPEIPTDPEEQKRWLAARQREFQDLARQYPWLTGDVDD